MIDKMKQIYEMQKKAKQIQKELKETEIEAKSADGGVTVVFNGEIHVVKIAIEPSLLTPESQHKLEQDLKNTIGTAISKAQGIAAEKAKSMMGDLGINLPGM